MSKARSLLDQIENFEKETGLLAAFPEAKYAGILFKHGNEGLFLKRSSTDEDYGGSWSIAGGTIMNGEDPYQASLRECKEELGMVPDHEIKGTYVHENGYVTHLAEVKEKFEPTLNHEHESSGWFGFDQLPSPVHPGVPAAIGSFNLA